MSGHGKFIWHELATSDVEAARDFYTKVVGWDTDVYGDAGMPYTRWKAKGEALGGLAPLPEEAKKNGAAPHWTAYVYVDDVDATLAKAKALGGGSCMPAIDLPTVGRIAHFADPQGAVLAILRPEGPEADWGMDMTPGHFVWNELMASDQEKAFEFYSALFGWEKMEAHESPMGVYQIYGKNGLALGGMMTRPDGYPYPPHWLYYVCVADLDAALGRVQAKGGTVMHGPMPVPGGTRVAQCVDPQGALFALNGE